MLFSEFAPKWQSTAAGEYRKLVADHSGWKQGIINEISALGTEGALDAGRAADAKLAGMVNVGGNNPLFAALQTLNSRLDQDFAALGMDPALTRQFVCGPVNVPDLNTGHIFYPDGSGLAYVTDALALAIRVLARRFEDMWRGHRADDVRDADDGDAVAALLRHEMVQQRISGTPSALSYRAPRAANHESMYVEDAYRFVLAHEYAHHALGHRRSGEPEPSREISDEHEHDADDLALDLLMVRDDAEKPAGVLGAIVGMLALSVHEYGFSLRSRHTHPPVDARLAKLLSRVDPSWQEFLGAFVVELRKPVSLAVDSRSAMPSRCWAQLFSDPDVDMAVEEREHALTITKLDWIMTRDATQIGDIVGQADRQYSADLGAGYALLRAGDLPGALGHWGVANKAVEKIRDPGRELSFYSVQQAVRSCAAMKRLGQAILAEGEARGDADAARTLHAAGISSVIWQTLAGSTT